MPDSLSTLENVTTTADNVSGDFSERGYDMCFLYSKLILYLSRLKCLRNANENSVPDTRPADRTRSVC